MFGVHHAEQSVHQERGAVGHRGVDNLALAGASALEKRGDDAEGEQHAAAAEIADQVERRRRAPALFADRVQGGGQRDVVDVVTGRMREGSGLPPAGHAPVDERGIALEADVRTEAQAFHDARAKALDQHVVALHQPENRFHAVGILQVHRDALAAPRQHVGPGRLPAGRTGPVDAHHLGAHIRQHHAAERSGPDALQFDDSKPREWSHGDFLAKVDEERQSLRITNPWPGKG